MYGLSKTDKIKVDEKLKKQKEFLEFHMLKDKLTGKIFPLSNVVVSAYHSPQRYYGEIQNRVNTLVDIAQYRALSSVFMTLTLPSKFHRKKVSSGKLIDNSKYEDIPVKTAIRELTKRFSRLRHDRALKELKKEQRVYFRAIEPHKNGTPHTHILLFIPKENIHRLYNAFKRLFPEKANDIQILDNESNAVSYIMKYINKTIPLSKKELLSDKEKYLNAWYAHHGIRRFTSSRTLAPLNLYRLTHTKFSLKELTQLHDNKSLTILTPIDSNKIIEISMGDELIYMRNENYQLCTQHDIRG